MKKKNAYHPPPMNRCATAVVLLLCVHTVALRVHAQTGNAGNDPSAKVTPPALQTFVEAEYPQEAFEQGLQADVDLGLTIETDGTVSEAVVLTPAGHGFDEAAVAAARQFVFLPAKRGTTPIRARITYRYVFEIKQPEPEPEPPGDQAPAQPSPKAPPAEPTPKRDLAEEADRFEAKANVDAPPREVVKRQVTKEELMRVAGTRGDALRTVELLPGVARPPFGAGLIIVRGSAPEDSEVFINGTSTPLLYHFGGLTSVFNSRLLEEINFYPGNFSVKYGRRMGGILDVQSRDPRSDAFHGVFDFNVIDTSVMMEGPISKTGSMAIAARRSYIDLVIDAVIPSDTFEFLAAPVYWDYQTLGTWRPTSKDRISFTAFGSSDTFRLLLNEPADSDPDVQGNIDLAQTFHRWQVRWRRQISSSVEQDLMASFGPSGFRLGVGEAFDLRGNVLDTNVRGEWRVRFSEKLSMTFGTDIQLLPFQFTYEGPPLQQSEGNPSNDEPLTNQPQVGARAVDTAFRPAAYAEADIRPVDPLRLLLGLRADYYSLARSWTFDPRAVAIVSADSKTRFKTGVGLFSQPPEFTENNPELGNRNLTPIHALHLGAGLERDLADGIRVGAEGFYKSLWNRVVGVEGGVDPIFENGGRGRIYGLELSGRVQPTGRRWFGFLSYTLSRSERKDRDGEPWRLFDFDQTHILTLAGTYQLGRGWEVSGTFRLITGNPTTPVTGSILDLNTSLYQPIYGPTNSERSAMFHRLDLRVEKQWSLRASKVALYLDVQNVYNRLNPEGFQYNYDYSERKDIPGLPIIPSLGLRVEL